ncbi:MAG: polysaccharide deacetylase family protein [Bacteroidales bacterium]|nr:polysaccharide deacetylase family protein [Bacteroidales bacterium]
MNAFFNSIINKIDYFISNHYISLFKEKNSLIAYLVHGLFRDADEFKVQNIHSQQCITIDLLRQFIEYHLENGFIFISPNDILNGLSSVNKYVLLTYDDGYYNNVLSLPIMHEYKIPSVFFISTGYVESEQCFWWDIIYRERVKRNIQIATIRQEIVMLMAKKNKEITQYIIDTFGDKAFKPGSDVDRPFKPQELKAFAEDPYVTLGNHTVNHSILTNCTSSEIREEIAKAQKYLLQLTDIEPLIISYPNGNFSSEVINIVQEEGLKLGITTIPRKNYLPILVDGEKPLLMNRFTLSGQRGIKEQCDYFRTDFRVRYSG